jgi:hypothetical protein
LSSNGERIAIGAPKNDGNGEDAGHVRVYEWNGASWGQLGNDIDGEDGDDRSGTAVSMSGDGNRLAIGAPRNDSNGEETGDHLGIATSLSFSGRRLVVGAHRNDGNGLDAGRVKIYEWDGTEWMQLGMDIDGENSLDLLGTAVSLSGNGDRVAIGAQRNDSNGLDAGHVRVYDWDGEDWLQLGFNIDGETAFDECGVSVSLSADGDKVAVGAHQNDGNGLSSTGHVRVFKWNGTGWEQLGADIDGEAESDLSGGSISLSADGGRVVIGAHRNDGNGLDAGHVRLYDWNGSSWEQIGMDIDGEAGADLSGRAVSLTSNGNRFAIGAIFNDGNGYSSGHARVYDIEPVIVTSYSEKSVLQVFPNPTSGVIELHGMRHETINIINSFGKVVFKSEALVSTFDISHLPNGVYFIRVYLNGRLMTKKIIKE